MAQSGFFGKRTETPKTDTETATSPAVTPATPATPVPATVAAATKPAGFFGATPSAGLSSNSADKNSKPDEAANPKESKLTVGPNIKLKGVEITDCDVLYIDGVVEATLDSKVMQISQQGSFSGTANIDVAEIHGTFEGDLTVREKLTVFATGKVTGKIRYGKLIVEEGANISGELSSAAN